MGVKDNIFLHKTAHAHEYRNPKQGQSKTRLPQRNIKEHANKLSSQLASCIKNDLEQKQLAAIHCKDGTYLEFSSSTDYDLTVKSLENRSQGIRLLTVQESSDNSTISSATVYVPKDKSSFFEKKIASYSNDVTSSGHPKYNDLISSIENIVLASAKSFWTDPIALFPDNTPVWCELWLRYDNNHNKKTNASLDEVEHNISEICSNYHIKIKKESIIFPERIVKLVYVNQTDMQNIILLCDHVAEFRRAAELNSFFTTSSNIDQKLWLDDLVNRVNYEDNNVSVCLLDTGIAAGHPLISPATDETKIHAINSFPKNDIVGHGSEMAGVALYYDLKKYLLSSEPVTVTHSIESVKILQKGQDNPTELYGSITRDAISIAEISHPSTKRVNCMAVTSKPTTEEDGRPTSWSASIDSITSGADEEDIKRLFLISAGNVNPSEFSDSGNDYPEVNLNHSIENPGQAWNAITVGAYTTDIVFDNDLFPGYAPVASKNQLSPYSSTSTMWKRKWPIKPDVLFNGGNMISNGQQYDSCPDLSLLTSSNNPLIKSFSTIWATSSATAQASCFCAKILEKYPHIWPETVRALVIHSADWTPEMKAQFIPKDKTKTAKRALLRTCGYGIPNLTKAIECMDNSVNMIIEDELQPYNNDKLNEMHMHKLPWPTEVLESLGSTPVTLKVTLSYFIEPSPESNGWKDKYRYQSCGLKFDVINKNEQLIDFEKRINLLSRGENKKDSGSGNSGSDRWYLGADNRDVGSIHSDFIEANAVDLCNCNYIAVYPISGWWKERKYLGKSDKKIRYSLIVSLSTPETSTDLYTPIITKIASKIETPIVSS